MTGRAEEDRPSGFGLPETLVALALLLIALSLGLGLYTEARRVFRRAQNLAEQQQAARVALHRLSTSIRLAGLGLRPDGDPARPDEAIEAAYATAITVRADFDGSDPAQSTDPETALAGPGAAFEQVSTGNDEIVSWVLAVPGEASAESLDLEADVGQTVRDGVVEPVSITDVALTQEAPPYVLYAIRLANDVAGCCGASFDVRSPVADNVRSLRFRYFDRTGGEIAPPGGAEDENARRRRASIARVRIELEVLTRDPVLLAAPSDRSAGRRKSLRLTTEVTLRNDR